MWVFSDRGMFSAVVDKANPEAIVVRTRVHGDAVNLVKLVPGTKLIKGGGTDYPFRVRMSREQWADAVRELATGIDYTNFKDSVTEKQGKRRHDVYLRVWGVLLSLESRRRTKHSGRHHRAAGERLFRDDLDTMFRSRVFSDDPAHDVPAELDGYDPRYG